METAEIVFQLANLVLQRPGRYDFRLFANTRFVGNKTFTVLDWKPQAGTPGGPR